MRSMMRLLRLLPALLFATVFALGLLACSDSTENPPLYKLDGGVFDGAEAGADTGG
jgi:hypothetical protein